MGLASAKSLMAATDNALLRRTVSSDHLWARIICSTHHTVYLKDDARSPLLLRKLLRLRVFLRQLTRSSLSSRVLTAQLERHEDAEQETHALEPEQADMTRCESRAIGGTIAVGGYDNSNVSKSNMHGHADATLSGASGPVAVPCDTL